jgi:hypothetical protein
MSVTLVIFNLWTSTPKLSIMVFSVVTPRRVIFRVKMETILSSKRLVTTHKTTLHHIPQYHNQHIQRREDFKFSPEIFTLFHDLSSFTILFSETIFMARTTFVVFARFSWRFTPLRRRTSRPRFR